jgi:hypothetical protein
MSQTVLQQQQQLLPEYQEEFLKDLLANIYQTQKDEEGNVTGVSGIAAFSPLFGQPVFNDQGQPVFELDSQGRVLFDQSGQPIQKVIGGVPREETARFTPAQMEAIRMGVEGVGAYQPMLEAGKETIAEGVQTLRGTTGRYDPTSYKEFFDPYIEQVVDATQQDITDDYTRLANKMSAQAAGRGAFGGSRDAIAKAQNISNMITDRAQTGAKLRSQAFDAAQKQAQTAFENQMKRGQNAATAFQNLGIAQTGVGQSAQALAGTDVNTLFNLGTFEQDQMQRELDTQRAAAIEEAYEPFERFGYMSNILRGIPNPGTSITTGAAPTRNRLGSAVGGAMGINAFQSEYGPILGGLI